MDYRHLNQTAQNAQTPSPSDGLASLLEINLVRTGDLANALEQLCDRLFGPTPQAVKGNGTEAPVTSIAVTSIAATARFTADQLDRCFAALNRIGDSL